MAWTPGTRKRTKEIYGYSLAQVIKMADDLMEEFPDELKSYDDFEIGDNPSLDYYTKKTEKELEAERKSAMDRLGWERRQYEELKKKFEGE